MLSARMPVTVAEKLFIQGGVGSPPWVPREVILSDGKQFVGLAETDSQLLNLSAMTKYLFPINAK